VEIAVVVVQGGGPFQRSEKYVGEAVTVDVPDGNARADEQVSVRKGVLVVDVVAVREAGA
jgi:regulator of RNase E activity RraA